MRTVAQERLVKLVTVLSSLNVMCAAICGAQIFTNFQALNDELRATITNQRTPDRLLLESISRLGPIRESPDFWTQIANDTNYTVLHRTRAVFALFRRHGERCGSVPDLSRCLLPCSWLKSSRIEKIPFVFGWIPVELNPGESVFAISVLYGPKIFIRILGEVPYETFVSGIQGTSHADLTILQYGYADDYDEWLNNESTRSVVR